MQPLVTTDILELADFEPSIGASIYLPVDPRPPAGQQARIMLQNLLRDAHGELVDRHGMRSSDAEAMLAAVRQQFESIGPWPSQARAAASFAAPGFSRWLWLPEAVEATSVIGQRFYVQPLLPLVSGPDADFTLLALSEQRVRLFAGHRFSLVELHPDDLPQQLSDVVTPDDPEQSLQLHTTGPQRNQRGIFHGHGGAKDVGDHAIEQFLRAVDHAVCAEVIRPGRAPAPLLLACVERLLPIYRRVSRHPELQPTPIAGNPDHAQAEALHRRAWELMAPRLQQRTSEAEARLGEAAAHGRAALDLDQVVEAACNARVAELFVAPVGTGAQLPREHALLDLAAVETLRNHGVVHAAISSDALDGRLAAAVLRY